MKQDNDLKVIKPFGPSIARAKMPEDLIINLNNHIEETISDKNKIDKLNSHSSIRWRFDTFIDRCGEIQIGICPS